MLSIRDHELNGSRMAVRTIAPENRVTAGSEPAVRAHTALHRADAICALALCLLTLLSWIPRWNGPLDLRWDGGTYFILGTSLAQGKGYRLLNEPGEIRADQYPPLLPAIVAAHEKLLSSSDPVKVGIWL